MLKSVPVCSSPNSISFNAILSAFSIGHKTLPEKSKLKNKTYTHHSRHLRYKSILISKSLNWKFRSLLYCDLTELLEDFSILTCDNQRPANASLSSFIGLCFLRHLLWVLSPSHWSIKSFRLQVDKCSCHQWKEKWIFKFECATFLIFINNGGN